MEKIAVDGLIVGFSSLIQHAHPSAIPEFMLWLDSQVAHYKNSKFAAFGKQKKFSFPIFQPGVVPEADI